MGKSATKPTIDLKASSDTGRSPIDNITSDLSPTLTGHAQAGTKVTIKDGNDVLATVTANKDGHWTYTFQFLEEGKHDLTAVTGHGDQRRTSDVLDVVIDTTAPAKTSVDLKASSDSGLSSTDNITDVAAPTLTGTAEKHATITIRDGHDVLGTTRADAHGHWSFTSTALEDGDHRLTAIVTDAAGNHRRASSALKVSIDTATPDAPTIDLDSGSDTGSSSIDNLTKDSTPVLTGTAEAGATVTIKDGATTLGTTTSDNAGIWSFVTDSLANGTHSLTAVATDAAGNTGSPATLSIIIDTQIVAPTISLSTDDGTPGDHTTTDPTLIGTAAAGTTISIFIDGSSIAADTVTVDSSGDRTSFLRPMAAK